MTPELTDRLAAMVKVMRTLEPATDRGTLKRIWEDADYYGIREELTKALNLP